MHRQIGVTMMALLGLGLMAVSGPAALAQRGGNSTQKPAPAASSSAPRFEVEVLWPKPLPNHWILGSVTGVAVDAQDHVWVLHTASSATPNTELGTGTNPPTAEYCCSAAPPVLEFDAAGNLLGHWGGPGQGYDWPKAPGGITVDAKGNVWIAAAGWPEPPAPGRGGRGRGAATADPATPPPPPPPPSHDAHILKFSRDGKFLQQIGKPGVSEGSASKTAFNRPANIEFDAAANELYVADGYGNHRVVVLDANTGAYKRHWGAYGAAPDDANAGNYDPAAPAAKQFRQVTCVTLAKDGTVYVCDRTNDRIQSFKKDGTFIKEASVAKETLANGSVWDIALSADPQQRYLFVADGQSHRIVILQRDTMAQVGTLGVGGRIPGRFNAPSTVAVDSRGNLYTGETFQGQRVQKFVPGK